METVLALLAGVGLTLIAQVFIPALGSYANRKAANLADKEDIARITKLVEDVKHENQLLLEQVKGRQQLRVAAAERRLQAHQEAFTLWRKLLKRTHHDDLASVISECQDWWEKNCIFLSPRAREAFANAFFAAHDHQTYEGLPRDKDTLAALQQAWKTMQDAAVAILEGAELPSLGEAEARDVSPPENADSGARGTESA